VVQRRFPETVAQLLLPEEAYEPGLGGPRPATSEEAAGRPPRPTWLPVVEAGGGSGDRRLPRPARAAAVPEAKPGPAAQVEPVAGALSLAPPAPEAAVEPVPPVPRAEVGVGAAETSVATSPLEPCPRRPGRSWLARPGRPRRVPAGHGVLRALARLDLELRRWGRCRQEGDERREVSQVQRPEYDAFVLFRCNVEKRMPADSPSHRERKPCMGAEPEQCPHARWVPGLRWYGCRPRSVQAFRRQESA